VMEQFQEKFPAVFRPELHENNQIISKTEFR
jgi:hypothetical protein